MKDQEARNAIFEIGLALRVLKQMSAENFMDNKWYIEKIVDRLNEFEETGKYRSTAYNDHT